MAEKTRKSIDVCRSVGASGIELGKMVEDLSARLLDSEMRERHLRQALSLARWHIDLDRVAIRDSVDGNGESADPRERAQLKAVESILAAVDAALSGQFPFPEAGAPGGTASPSDAQR